MTLSTSVASWKERGGSIIRAAGAGGTWNAHQQQHWFWRKQMKVPLQVFIQIESSLIFYFKRLFCEFFHLICGDLWTSDEELWFLIFDLMNDFFRNFSAPEKLASLTEVRSLYIHPLNMRIICFFKYPISQCKYSYVVRWIVYRNAESITKASSRTGQAGEVHAPPDARESGKKWKRVTFRLSSFHE